MNQKHKGKNVSELMEQSTSQLIAHYWHYVQSRGVNVPCPVCDGTGTREYPDTGTWRHSAGDQIKTTDVCDWCWGSGDEHRHWTNIREIRKLVL